MLEAASAVLQCTIVVHLATKSLEFSHHPPSKHPHVLHVGLLHVGDRARPYLQHYVASYANQAVMHVHPRDHDINPLTTTPNTKQAALALVDLKGTRHDVKVTMCKGPGDLDPYTPELPPAFELLRRNTNLMFTNRKNPLPPPSPTAPLRVHASGVVKDGDRALDIASKSELTAPGNVWDASCHWPDLHIVHSVAQA